MSKDNCKCSSFEDAMCNGLVAFGHAFEDFGRRPNKIEWSLFVLFIGFIFYSFFSV